MERVLSCADAVIATTQASAEELRGHCNMLKHSPSVSCIYNGFDPDDLVGLQQPSQRASDAQRFRIVYTGTLWRLTDIGPLVCGLLQLAILGIWLTGNRLNSRLASVAALFLVMNVALLIGTLRWILAPHNAIWNPTRRPGQRRMVVHQTTHTWRSGE